MNAAIAISDTTGHAGHADSADCFLGTSTWIRHCAKTGTDLTVSRAGESGFALSSAAPAGAEKQWLRAEWRESETGREAKFYSLTAAGRKQLVVEKESWARLSDAVQLIFDEGN